MGAWSEEIFGNDDASDFAYDVIESDEVGELLSDVFGIVEDEDMDYLEGPDGSMIIAGAAIVAAAVSGDKSALTEDLQKWIVGKEDKLKSLAGAAVVAVKRVLGEDSELKELWEETENFEKWKGTVDAVLKGLGAAA